MGLTQTDARRNGDMAQRDSGRRQTTDHYTCSTDHLYCKLPQAIREVVNLDYSIHTLRLRRYYVSAALCIRSQFTVSPCCDVDRRKVQKQARNHGIRYCTSTTAGIIGGIEQSVKNNLESFLQYSIFRRDS